MSPLKDKLAELINITVNNGKNSVLKNLNLEIRKGEFLGIIGKNGCGKTALLKLIAGIIKPDSGELIVPGDCKTGYVFQNPDNQIIGTTVEEDLAFGLENMGIEREEMNGLVDSIVKEVNMESFRHRDTLSLSGGQKQRLAIASVLIMNPDLLLLDEPLSMIDRAERANLQNFIGGLNRTRKTAIVVCVSSVEQIANCDRIIFLDKGEIIFDGNYKELTENPEIFEKAGLPVPFLLDMEKKRGNQN